MPETEQQEISTPIPIQDLNLEPQTPRRLFINNRIFRSFAHLLGFTPSGIYPVHCNEQGHLFVADSGHNRHALGHDRFAVGGGWGWFNCNVQASRLDFFDPSNINYVEFEYLDGTVTSSVYIPQSYLFTVSLPQDVTRLRMISENILGSVLWVNYWKM